MSGIRRSANRPKTAKHLRNASDKKFTNRTAEDREKDHALTDAWAARQTEKVKKERIEAKLAKKRKELLEWLGQSDFVKGNT